MCLKRPFSAVACISDSETNTDEPLNDNVVPDDPYRLMDDVDIQTIVLLMAWDCLQKTPDKCKHPLFSTWFSEQSDLEDTAPKMHYAPGLKDLLKSKTAPLVSEFEELPGGRPRDLTPEAVLKGWGIYLLVLKKRGHKPRIYIRSSTDSKRGLRGRACNYRVLRQLPKYVDRSVKEGFEIVHMGLICWTTFIPGPALVPELRLFFLLLEAAFAFSLWAMRSATKDYGMEYGCFWDRSSLEYSGLCSHSSLHEGIPGEFDLSAEQLVALAEKKREKDRLRRNRKAGTYRAKHRERLNPQQKSVRRSKQSNKTWYCKPCRSSLPSEIGLRIHNESPMHKRRLAGVDAKEKARYRFYCDACLVGYNPSGEWKRHLTKAHHKHMSAPDSSEDELDSSEVVQDKEDQV